MEGREKGCGGVVSRKDLLPLLVLPTTTTSDAAALAVGGALLLELEEARFADLGGSFSLLEGTLFGKRKREEGGYGLLRDRRLTSWC